MKIVLLCHYFYPEIGAPSARLFEMGKRWVQQGHEVHVVTCFPNHPTGVIPDAYQGKIRMTETIQGIIVHRNYVYATPNEGFVKKTLGHVSFAISSVLLSSLKVPKPDVVIVSSPTLFSVISGYVFSLLRKAPFIFEVRDLWPDAIIKLGVLKNKTLIRALEGLEMFLYRRSRLVVTVTEAFKKNIVSRGIDSSKVAVITNGVDTDKFDKHRMTNDGSLAKKYGWAGKKILLYAGAHGISQGLTTLLDVANTLRDRTDLLFVLAGEGAEKRKLIKYAEDLHLANVQFIDPLPKEDMPALYASAYLSFVPLRNIAMFDNYIPSKMFEILGSGCPIIASLSGEAAEILRKSGGAVVVQPEDIKGIQAGILKVIQDTDLREVLSSKGYEFVINNYSREHLADKYLQTMETKLAIRSSDKEGE